MLIAKQSSTNPVAAWATNNHMAKG